jgi:Zn-dependent protease with chaperone function
MTREQFDQLVHRIECRFASRPWALRIDIFFRVLLGYGVFLLWFMHTPVIGAVLLLLAPMIDDSVVALVLFAIGSLLVVLGSVGAMRLLWGGMDAQLGRQIHPQEAPRLFEVLAGLQESLQSKQFHKVLVTADFNASVQFIPRLGIFGWPQRILCLGLPLWEALSQAEAESVLAHEFAHLSAQHGRFGAWVYRLRQSWQRTFEDLGAPMKSYSRGTMGSLLLGFVNWYWPRFNARALVLSRTNEYEADAFSAEWSGKEAAASALWRMACYQQRLNDEFFPSLWRQAASEPAPPADITSRLAVARDQPPTNNHASRWMQQALQRLTDNADTHPSPADRLDAIGHSADACYAKGYPGVARPSAAAFFFGGTLGAIRRDIDVLWQQETREAWENRRRQIQSVQNRLTSLENANRNSNSATELLWDKANCILDLEGPEKAEPILRRLLDRTPDHSGANLALGQILLNRGSIKGEDYLQRVLSKEDDALIPQACEALSRYFLLTGRSDRVDEVHKQLSRFQAAISTADKERNMVTASDRFLPHDLAPDHVAALHDVLSGQEDLAVAYLVRKELRHFSRQPLFVLCVRSAAGFWSIYRGDRDRFVAAQVTKKVKLPGRVLVIAPQGHFRALGRVVMATRGALVYPPVDTLVRS